MIKKICKYTFFTLAGAIFLAWQLFITLAMVGATALNFAWFEAIMTKGQKMLWWI